jgi:hypothetical protein
MKFLKFLFLAGAVSLAHAEEITDCAALESDEQRLECYDKAAQRAGAPAQDAVTEQALPKVASENEPTATPELAPEDLFGKSAEESSEIVAEAVGLENIDEISARVVAVTRDPYRRYTVTLDNGQKWQQSRTDRFDIDVGDDVVVRKAALGSFTLQNVSGGGQTKVRRVE